MTAPNHDRRFLLPDDQVRRIFVELIQPVLLPPDATPQQNPKMVLLTGQPGAGKSSAMKSIRKDFGRDRRPVAVSADDFRSFFPNYLKLVGELGSMRVNEEVQEYARQWRDMAVDYLVSMRADIIMERGLNKRSTAKAVLAKFAEAPEGQRPYRVEGALLATSRGVSRQNMLTRFQVSLEQSGYGRYPGDDLHDRRDDHLPTVADWFDAEPTVAAVAIYLQGADTAVDRNYRDESGEWVSPVSTRDALVFHRNARLSLAASREWLLQHASLSARMDERWQPSLARAWNDIQPSLAPDATRLQTTLPAVTFDRFPVVTSADLDLVVSLLQDFPHVVVGVVDVEARPPEPVTPGVEHAGFYAIRDMDADPTRNPMSVEERVAMWRATVAAANLNDKVTIEPVPRPELFPRWFNARFLADRSYVALRTDPSSRMDAARNQAYSEILGRQVVPVAPRQGIDAAAVAEMYRGGNMGWDAAIARGAREVFAKADGARRVFEASPSTAVEPTRSGFFEGLRRLARFRQLSDDYTGQRQEYYSRVEWELTRLRQEVESGAILSGTETDRALTVLAAIDRKQLGDKDPAELVSNPARFQVWTQEQRRLGQDPGRSSEAGREPLDALMGAVSAAIRAHPRDAGASVGKNGAQHSPDPWAADFGMDAAAGQAVDGGAAPAAGD